MGVTIVNETLLQATFEMQSNLSAKLDMITMMYIPETPGMALQSSAEQLKPQATQRQVVQPSQVIKARPAPEAR